MPTFVPTGEQEETLKAFKTGQDMKILARAGTGKTSTLSYLVESCPDRKILYMTFDKRSSEEFARKCKDSLNLKAKNFHSYCYTSFLTYVISKFGEEYGEHIKNRMHTGDKFLTKSADIATYLGITTPAGLKRPDPQNLENQTDILLPPVQQVIYIKGVLKNFYNSSSDTLKVSHFKGDSPSEELFKNAVAYLNDILSPEGRIAWKNADIYAKIWCMRNPSLSPEYDVLLIDEAQDTNSLQASFYKNQTLQKVYVGDSFQHIYSFRGDQDELKDLEVPVTMSLTKSFRFGQKVADLAANIINSSALSRTHGRVTLEGLSPHPGHIALHVDNPDMYLVRRTVTVLDLLMDDFDMFYPRKIRITAKQRDALENLLTSLDWFVQNPLGAKVTPAFMHEDLVDYETLDQIKSAIASGSLPPRVKKAVSLLEQRGYDHVFSHIQSFVRRGGTPKKGTVVTISTVHGAKGAEAPVVQVADDFRLPYHVKENGERYYFPFPEEEMFIAYVAVTRAQESLGLGSLSWVQDSEALQNIQIKP